MLVGDLDATKDRSVCDRMFELGLGGGSRCGMRRRGFGLRLQMMKKSRFVRLRPAESVAKWMLPPATLPLLS
jgi:hypothetical protein